MMFATPHCSVEQLGKLVWWWALVKSFLLHAFDRLAFKNYWALHFRCRILRAYPHLRGRSIAETISGEPSGSKNLEVRSVELELPPGQALIILVQAPHVNPPRHAHGWVYSPVTEAKSDFMAPILHLRTGGD